MATISIVLLIAWFALYIIFKFINPYLGSAYVLITFLFSYVVSNQSFSAFYLLAYLVALVVDLAIGEINTTSQSTSSFKFGRNEIKGFNYIAICLIAGLVIYLGITQLSRVAGGNIVGVPNLAITSSSQIGQAF